MASTNENPASTDTSANTASIDGPANATSTDDPANTTSADAAANTASADAPGSSHGSQQETPRYYPWDAPTEKGGFLEKLDQIPAKGVAPYFKELQQSLVYLKDKRAHLFHNVFLAEDVKEAGGLLKFLKETAVLEQRFDGWLGESCEYELFRRSSILPDFSQYNVPDHPMKYEKLRPLQTIIGTHINALVIHNQRLKEFAKGLTAPDREAEVVKDGLATVEVLTDKTEAWVKEIYEFGINLEATRKSQKAPEPLGLVCAKTKQVQKVAKSPVLSTTLLNHLLPMTYKKDDSRLDSFNKLGFRTVLCLHHLQTLSNLLESRKLPLDASLQDDKAVNRNEDFATIWKKTIEALKMKTEGGFEDVYHFADDMARHTGFDEEKGIWDWFHFKMIESEDCMEFDRACVRRMVDLFTGLATILDLTSAAPSDSRSHDTYNYVAVFSVDGMHGSDVEKYIALRPQSTIAQLLETGYEYTNAFTSAPSDSFPGTLAQFTGASPKTTGVWYDDAYDRTFYSPVSETEKHCEGKSGAEVVYDESIDYNSTKLFSGGINPANLPQAKINGQCQPVYPHNRVRVNSIWEIVEAKGLETAYTDKHPAYDLVRGRSGKGLTVGYFPEIAAVDSTVNATIAYDQLHVDAFLAWIDGKTPANSEVQGRGLSGTPALFGGNFQAVNVAQKQSGYQNGSLAFTPGLLTALDFVDRSLGKVVAALEARGVYDDTLVIVASKHGQAPINPALFRKVDPKLLASSIGVNVSHITTDDIALIWLEDQRTLATAVANLNNARTALKIQDIIYGERLKDMDFGGDPSTDPAVPDIIVRPTLGTIYTTSTSKIAEHGGLSDDDRHVACFVSNPRLKRAKVAGHVTTRRVGPTILKALGINPRTLQGAVAERVALLQGF
ncbi:MAG: hypothetical protein Q9228_001293 [Teloschistes exilis]